MKRFTETEKWVDPWFRRLGPETKLFWCYIVDNCDNAGVWTVDLDLFELLTGVSITPEKVLRELGDRIRDVGNGRFWIPKFVQFQFGDINPLSSNISKVHLSVLSLLRKHGLETLWKEYAIPFISLQEKEKEKDKVLEKGSGGKPSLPPEEQVYELYPLKVAKAAALKAIRKALETQKLDFLLERTALFAKVRNGNLDFCPHPSTWFHQERYNDDPAAWAPRVQYQQLPRGYTPQKPVKSLMEQEADELLRQAQNL